MINNIANSSINYTLTDRSIKKNNKEADDKQLNKADKIEKESVTAEISKNKVSEKEKRYQINYMINQANQQAKNFEKLISSVFSKQSNKVGLATMANNGRLKDFYKNLVVDPKTVEQAKKDISEDGYYGVKQTSERILSFAKAIAGDNPEKIQEMRDAVEKGFKKAEDMWGGELPEISQKTYDRVMETFDKWQGKTNN